MARRAASACAANWPINSKKPDDCPAKRPIPVRKASAFEAAFPVVVGRMIEHRGRLVLRNGQGSGMIRLVWNNSPPKDGEFRSGNVNPLVGSVSGAIGVATAFPAVSNQV